MLVAEQQCVLALCVLCLGSFSTVAAQDAPPEEHVCMTFTEYKLKKADCARKNLKIIPQNLDHDIHVIEMSDNELTYLRRDVFEMYVSLQEIYLEYNRIDTIAPHAFRGMSSLQKLDLGENRLNTVPSESFVHTPHLRILILKDNQIRYITRDDFQRLSRIEELNFHNNLLDRIDPQAFANLKFLNEINLGNNELASLSANMRDYLPTSVNVLRLYGNPWRCDCHLRWLIEWVIKQDINWQFGGNVPTCSDPPMTREQTWQVLQPVKFACPARILPGSPKTIAVNLGENVSIPCLVSGDPTPRISWQKSGQGMSKENVTETNYTSESGEQVINSTLSLTRVTMRNIADYQCVIENIAGRAEATYNLWLHTYTPTPSAKEEDSPFFNKMTIIGLSAGGGGMVMLILLCILCYCCCRKQRKRRQAYQVRGAEYQKQQQQQQQLKQRVETHKEKDVMSEADEKKATIKKEKVRFLASPTIEGHTDLLLEKEPTEGNHVPTTDLSRPVSIIQNNLNDLKSNEAGEFKMKIFTSFQEPSTLDPLSPDADSGGLGLSDIRTSPEGTLREATPDLLCDEKHTRSLPQKSPTPPPPPAAYFANHLASSTQTKRAKENPYVKPSELKAGARTPDGVLEHSFSAQGAIDMKLGSGAPSPRPANKDKKAPFSTSSAKPTDVTCTNPVCIKVHKSAKDCNQHTGTTGKPLSSSQSVGSMSDLDMVGRSIEGILQRSHSRDEDRYQTLPCRQPGPSTKSSMAATRKLPSAPTRSPSSSPQHLERPSKPRVQFASPVRECSPTERQWTSPTSSHSSSSSSSNPLHPVGLKVMSPEGPKTLTFAGAIDALASPPTAKQSASRLYGCSTSIDDLLSPPFQTFSNTPDTVRKAKSGQTIPPRPGEKDEFGTAV